MATDKVIIKGIKAFGYHGVFDLEKKSGQDFIVDIEYSYDTSDAIDTDDISKAIDYAAISNLVKNIGCSYDIDKEDKPVECALYPSTSKLEVSFGPFTISEQSDPSIFLNIISLTPE